MLRAVFCLAQLSLLFLSNAVRMKFDRRVFGQFESLAGVKGCACLLRGCVVML